jgi:outer membrane biosynthesis protein TonB
VRSIPRVDQAALDAARQWEYTPDSPERRAGAVLVTVTINFTRQYASAR